MFICLVTEKINEKQEETILNYITLIGYMCLKILGP